MLFTGSAALAQTAPRIESTPIPKPAKPNFSSLRWLVGTWSCSNTSSRRPAKIPYSVTYMPSSDGYWLNATIKAPGVAWFPYPATNRGGITYDDGAKRWVSIDRGDFGGYNIATSAGVNGSTITWHPFWLPDRDIRSMGDIVWTKVSATRMTSHSSFITQKSRTVTVTGSCTKGGTTTASAAR
jgi:hypothetical protein